MQYIVLHIIIILQWLITIGYMHYTCKYIIICIETYNYYALINNLYYREPYNIIS